MLIEAAVAIASGIAARSIALTGFGADSVIELLSAAVVMRQLLRRTGAGSDGSLGEDERKTSRLVGWALFGVIAYIVLSSALSLILNSSYQASTRPGRFGYGWTDSYSSSVVLDVNQNATVYAANGSSVVFTWTGTAYQAAPKVLATLVKNVDGTFTFTQKDQTQMRFDAVGNLNQIVDRNGYATSLAYTAGQLTTVTDPAGRALTFTWTGGHVTSVADSASPQRTVVYQYSAAGDLAQVTDMGGGVTAFSYDALHQMLTMKDAKCSADVTCPGVANTYTGGQVTQQQDMQGRITKFSYANGVTTVTDPRNNIVQYEYINNVVLSETHGVGTAQQATTRYSYDPNTLGQTVTVDPNGNSWTAVRDGQANILSSTDPLGQTTTYSMYNAFNEPQQVTDATSVSTTYTYDTHGNLTQSSRPLVGSVPAQSQTVTYVYGDPLHPGDLTQMTDADGKVWTYTYDANGYRNSVSDPLGDKTTYTYDNVGRLTSSVSPRGNVAGGNPALLTTTYQRNAFGQPTQIQDPLAHVTSYSYDANQNLASVTDPNLHVTSYKYDFDNEQTEVDRQDGSKLFTAYDATGNVQSQTDGLSHSTTYGYDALNRKSSMTDALSRVTNYSYDAAGNLAALTDAKGQTTGYGYDFAGRLISISYSDHLTPNASFTYDALGERLSMSDGTGTTSYGYDSLKRLTQSTNGAGAQLRYGYDLKGQLTSITYPGTTGTVSRTYDAAGRLAGVQDWLSHSTTFSYDPDSDLTTINYPNTVVASYVYDNADRLSSITHAAGPTTLLSFSYTRDSAGQLTADAAKSYGYDTINRLNTYTNGPTTGLTYGYDAADRLTSSAIQGGNTTTFAYDLADQLQTATTTNGTTQVQKLTYAFDGNGNRASVTDQVGNKTTTGYDQANRLKAYGASASYLYNGDGLRMSKTVGGTAEAFVWDAAEGLPLTVQDGATFYVTGPGGVPLEQISGTTVYYFHSDQLGSTRALTDSLGAVQQSYDYDPYGNPISSSGLISNPFQYAGQYLDSESGFYYLRHRYYDPSTAQFTSRDPLGGLTGAPYQYAADSPLNGIDPTGKFVMVLVAAAVTAPEWGPIVVGGLMLVGAAVVGFVGAHVAHAIYEAHQSQERDQASTPTGRIDREHDSYDKAREAAQGEVGDKLGDNPERMYDPDTGTIIGEQSADGKCGWRADEGHFNWWDWTGGKKGRGGRYGHDYYPQDQTGPHSPYPGAYPWES